MKKIETVFVREDTKPFRVTPVIRRGCEWVANGEGVATRKWDGTACMVRDGVLYKRLHWGVDAGDPPRGWLHHDFDPNATHGHGWALVGDGPEDWAHRIPPIPSENGTYEMCGPRVNKNPEGFEQVLFRKHGDVELDAPRDFDGLREFLLARPEMEGIVWHHPDGRMAKIKRRDFK